MVRLKSRNSTEQEKGWGGKGGNTSIPVEKNQCVILIVPAIQTIRSLRGILDTVLPPKLRWQGIFGKTKLAWAVQQPPERAKLGSHFG